VALAIAYPAEDGQGLCFRAGPEEVVDLLQRRSFALQGVELPLESLEVGLFGLGLELALGAAA
jgi:hypothetical protein